MTKVAQSGCDLAHFDEAVNFGLLKEGGGGGFVAPFPPWPTHSMKRMQCSAPQQNQPDHTAALPHFCHTICPSLFIAQLLFISGVRGRYCLIPPTGIPPIFSKFIGMKTELGDTILFLAVG